MSKEALEQERIKSENEIYDKAVRAYYLQREIYDKNMSFR